MGAYEEIIAEQRAAQQREIERYWALANYHITRK